MQELIYLNSRKTAEILGNPKFGRTISVICAKEEWTKKLGIGLKCKRLRPRAYN